jgi:hypothetical protein
MAYAGKYWPARTRRPTAAPKDEFTVARDAKVRDKIMRLALEAKRSAPRPADYTSVKEQLPEKTSESEDSEAE